MYLSLEPNVLKRLQKQYPNPNNDMVIIGEPASGMGIIGKLI
jgi:hypothetical protein